MKLVFFVALFCLPSWGQIPPYDAVEPREDYNFVLGTHAIGGKYNFGDESALVDQVRHVRGMGSNILKISLGANALKAYRLPPKKANNTLEFFLATPDFKQVFDMDFKYVFAWVHTLTGVKWRNGFSKYDEQTIYNEMYEFTSYLLKEYSGTGKMFFIGNWEGDWLLHKGFDRYSTPPKSDVKNMTKWFQIRQRAIDDAKNNTPHHDVSMYHYVEVNLVLKGMEGETCIAKSVLPKLDVDFVSYSSYEAIKNKNYKEKKQTLEEVFEFIEKRLKPKEGLPFERRVFMGEYGYHANKNKPESFLKQFDETKEIMQISLELNIPFALHWQMYNNEYDRKGNSKQMSLINEEGKKRPLYFLHQNYYREMSYFLIAYKNQNGYYPEQKLFNQKAIEIIDSIQSHI